MIKRLATVLTFCALAASSAPAHAGGWSVLTLDDLPNGVVVNQPITIGFALRQHGVRLVGGQSGGVIFERPGEKALRFNTHATKAEGHYTATVTLPKAGVWQWRIDIFGEHKMPPLTVQASTANRPAAETRLTSTQLQTLGKDLFVAKGCADCHWHQDVYGSGSFRFAYGAGGAPNLTTPKFDAAYLRVWLKDPKAVKPQTQMPSFKLRANEIEALTAFLMQRPSVAKK